jgi:hypothetical protein
VNATVPIRYLPALGISVGCIGFCLALYITGWTDTPWYLIGTVALSALQIVLFVCGTKLKENA